MLCLQRNITKAGRIGPQSRAALAGRMTGQFGTQWMAYLNAILLASWQRQFELRGICNSGFVSVKCCSSIRFLRRYSQHLLPTFLLEDHSLFEWFNPLYLADKESNFTSSEFVDQKIYKELLDLVTKYKPSVIWSDGDWEANSEYWKSKEFLAWLYNDSPVKDTVVTNDRWGTDAQCAHGDYLTCSDRFNPGYLLEKKWENAFTIDRWVDLDIFLLFLVRLPS